MEISSTCAGWACATATASKDKPSVLATNLIERDGLMPACRPFRRTMIPLLLIVIELLFDLNRLRSHFICMLHILKPE
jgi:hypothetical protein